MTGTRNTEAVTAPSTKIEEEPSGSDADALADELGTIGVHTVDEDKVKAPVEKITTPDSDTVRLWYRFPTGELVPEDFDRPMMFEEGESKLARVVVDAGFSAATFSRLEASDTAQVVLEKTTVTKNSVDIDALLADAPLRGTEFSEDAAASDCLCFRQSKRFNQRYVTWRAVDPVEHDDNESEDGSKGNSFARKAFKTGVLAAVMNWLLYFIAADFIA